MYLSITGVTSDKRLAKYQRFNSEADADAHAAEYSGFVVEDPGGNQQLWTVDASAKTVTRDEAVEQAKVLQQTWEILRRERNTKLNASDWVSNRASETGVEMSDDWKAYRKALRDLPSTLDNTTVLKTITWPTEPN